MSADTADEFGLEALGMDEDLFRAIVGQTPRNFTDNTKQAMELGVLLKKAGYDDRPQLEEVLMIAALAQHVVRYGDSNIAAFGIRARQLASAVDTDKPSLEDFSPLSRQSLLNKLQEVTKRVALTLYKRENFVLVFFANGENGYQVYGSSVDEATALAALKRQIAILESNQAERS